jgi:hypothetical protein
MRFDVDEHEISEIDLASVLLQTADILYFKGDSRINAAGDYQKGKDYGKAVVSLAEQIEAATKQFVMEKHAKDIKDLADGVIEDNIRDRTIKELCANLN